jgi:hypothetical protein
MSRYPLLLLPVLAGAVLVLTGAFKAKPHQLRPLVEPAGTTASDAEALDILDRAAAALAPDRVRWLEAKIWQQAVCEDFSYQACGRLLTAPGDRSRYDLNVKVGGTVGELRLVCDGQTLTHTVRLGDDKPTLLRWDLTGAREAGRAAEEKAEARLKLVGELGFTGLAPLLRGLRQRGQGARHAELTWNGTEVIVIGLALPEEPPSMQRPRFQVRQCCLFLDAQTLWPHRVEWWGNDRPGHPDQLVMQTEYRSPILNQPLPAGRCAAEFAVAVP